MLTVIDRNLASRSEHARWQAAIALGELAQSAPDRIWPLVLKHGSRRHADVRMAIATCVLEHILEYATSLPATGWTTVTNAVATIGDRLSVTVDTGASKRFFRLRKL